MRDEASEVGSTRKQHRKVEQPERAARRRPLHTAFLVQFHKHVLATMRRQDSPSLGARANNQSQHSFVVVDGTLEVGKLGDMLILSGNPLDGYWNFLNPKVVIKGGEVMIDKRGRAPAHGAH